MTTAGSAIGRRAKIVDMLHSPARTRVYASWLLGQRGTVVGILLNGTLALVELDGEPSEPLGGARRWPIHWDDLLVYSVDAGPANAEDGYRLGLSGLERDAFSMPYTVTAERVSAASRHIRCRSADGRCHSRRGRLGPVPPVSAWQRRCHRTVRFRRR